MVDITSFFEKVDRVNGGDGIIWAKATAPRGSQVILELKTPLGDRIKVPPLQAGDPICLSKYAFFDALKSSTDITRCATSGLIRLMTTEEADAYFQKKAGILKRSADDLKREADRRSREAVTAKQLDKSKVDKSARMSDLDASRRSTDLVYEDDIVNPRVINLCHQVSPLLKEEQRLSVMELQEQLLALEDSMTLDDAQYVEANGFYPSIKKWGRAKVAELAETLGIAPASDELSDDEEA